MRIAQIAPLYESVPPRLYGGTERIVSYLTEELVRQGHDVTLFASGDSRTSAALVPCCARGLRLDPSVIDPLAHHLLMVELVRSRSEEFDVLHFHTDYLHFSLFRDIADRTLTTLHGRLDLPDLQPVYHRFNHMPLVSISMHQRRPMPPVRWEGTVHHGLPLDLYRPTADRGEYLAFIGRIAPEKRPDLAIETAKRAGVPLKIAAKVDKIDLGYFDECISPLLDHPLIEFIGEIPDTEKAAFLGGARAMLFPIAWPEPFGLVMIEAMAVGTPVIAFPAGSVPEIVEDGVTGLLAEDVDDAVDAVRHLDDLDRSVVRRRFEERFSIGRMVSEYLDIYRRLASGRALPAMTPIGAGLDGLAPITVILK